MKQQAPRRKVLALAMAPAAFALGVLVAVLVASSASASSPLPTTTGSTTGTTTTTTSSTTGSSLGGFDQNSPQAQFLVINGTVNATSDHEIVGSSAFPNYVTGAVDNYYSLAHSYMDNSPFSEGTASPADTGPVGQTAAAGNAQQPQYADARWPGGPATANYGSKGQPVAEAGAYESLAKASASEASNGLAGPGLGGSKTLPVPKGFDNKLQQALAGWKTKYMGCPAPPKTSKSPVPTVTTPKVTVPAVKTPTTTVTTPLGTVTTPSAPSASSTPTVSVPKTRSLSSVPTPCSSKSGSGSDGESLLESSSLAVLVPGTADTNKDITKVDTTKLETNSTTTTATTDTTQTAPTTTGAYAWTPKPYTLMTSGSSSVGRVTLGGGQIVIKGISVDASIENDGTATPTYKANVSVAAASIGGIPVTIDQDGVHVANQHQALPYKQASDSLNSALKQAGIQIFLVAPQVTNCSQSSGASTSTSTTTTATASTTTDQSGTAGPCAQTGAATGTCSGTDTGTDTTSTSSSTTTTTTTTSSSPPLPAGSGGTDTTSTAPPPCPPPPATCDTGTTSTGSTTTTGNTTTGTTPTAPSIGGSTTNSTTTGATTTTSTDTTSIGPSSCSGAPPTTGSCPGTSTGTTTTTTSTDTTGTGSVPNPLGGAGTEAGQETIVMATGVHVVFTQPVSPSGVPAQFVEHILGEVFVHSLAAPAAPLPAITPVGGGVGGSSSCAGGKHSKSSLRSSGGGGSSTAGGSSGGGSLGSSSGSSSLSPTASALGASSQPGAGGSSQSLPAAFATALKKPLWLLLAYLVWQLLVIGTGWSLWNWRRGEHT